MLWQNVFMCNIPHIDAQHKALFEQIERIGAMHGDISRIPETLEFLTSYTTEHFSDEQSLHEQTRYPRALEHRRQHSGFVAKINQLKSEYEHSGHNLTNLMTMNHALVEWLTDHVMTSDKEFSLFFHDLPEETRASLRLPRRPWIPESSQVFYEKVTGVRPRPDTSRETGVTSSGGGTTTRISSSWTDSLLCGIPEIDEQHKELFRQIDMLRDHHNKDRIPMVLRFLADYVVKHFNDEEAIHRQSGYPQAPGHRKLHEKFVQSFYESKEKFDKSQGDFKVLMEVNKLVYDWLRDHVMKVDKQFAKYYLPMMESQSSSAGTEGDTRVQEGTRVREGTRVQSTTRVLDQGGTTRVRRDTSSGGAQSSWTDSLLCGIDSIDEQHKELFRQVDILRDHGNKDRVPAVLEFLTNYVVEHFSHEENLHRRSRYPQAAGHKKLHDEFVKTFLASKERIDKSEGDFKILMEVNKIVFDWLREHVMKVDKAFARYYLSR